MDTGSRHWHYAQLELIGRHVQTQVSTDKYDDRTAALAALHDLLDQAHRSAGADIPDALTQALRSSDTDRFTLGPFTWLTFGCGGDCRDSVQAALDGEAARHPGATVTRLPEDWPNTPATAATPCRNHGCSGGEAVVTAVDTSGIEGMVCRDCARLPQFALSFA